MNDVEKVESLKKSSLLMPGDLILIKTPSTIYESFRRLANHSYDHIVKYIFLNFTGSSFGWQAKSSYIIPTDKISSYSIIHSQKEVAFDYKTQIWFRLATTRIPRQLKVKLTRQAIWLLEGYTNNSQ